MIEISREKLETLPLNSGLSYKDETGFCIKGLILEASGYDWSVWDAASTIPFPNIESMSHPCGATANLLPYLANHHPEDQYNPKILDSLELSFSTASPSDKARLRQELIRILEAEPEVTLV